MYLAETMGARIAYYYVSGLEMVKYNDVKY